MVTQEVLIILLLLFDTSRRITVYVKFYYGLAMVRMVTQEVLIILLLLLFI